MSVNAEDEDRAGNEDRGCLYRPPDAAAQSFLYTMNQLTRYKITIMGIP
jgi:hypothetical protein